MNFSVNMEFQKKKKILLKLTNTYSNIIENNPVVMYNNINRIINAHYNKILL